MKILLAIDGSPYSEAAADAVIAQRPTRGTEVEVLHVLEPQLYAAGYGPGIEDEMDRARELAEAVAEKLREAGFGAHATVGKGDPRTVILDVAQEFAPDLIVVGSHGRTGVIRMLLGSVSETVAKHARCSVQVVRPAKS